MPLKYTDETHSSIRKLSKPQTLRLSERVQRELQEAAVLLATIRGTAQKDPSEAAQNLNKSLGDNMIILNSAFQDATTTALKASFLGDAVDAVAEYALATAQIENPTTDELLSDQNQAEPLDDIAKSNYSQNVEIVDAVEPQERFKMRRRGRRTGEPTSSEAKFLDFRRAIQQVEDPYSAPLQLADMEQYFGDVIVDSVQQSYNCPITGQVLEDPVRARCGHVFSRAAIMGLFTAEILRIDCPQMRCSGKITADTLESDEEMAVVAARWKADQERQQLEERSTMDRV